MRRLALFALTAACAAAHPAAPNSPTPPNAAATAANPAAAPPSAERGTLPSIASKVAGARALPGLFPLYWDERAGKLWLEIAQWQTEFLYQSGLPAGVGSNDIGLDRGQLGATRVVRFERVGPKVLLVQSNLGFRATGAPPDEQRAVRESFAESALWGFTVAGETGGRVVVDASEFFLRDAHELPATLKEAKQGAFHLDPARSALALDHTRNFPRNTEVEATLTFAGDEPGAWVRQVTPAPTAITVREHHSFIALPPAGYQPRHYDPRSSFYGISYQDYATPISEPIVQRWTSRHRLRKADPAAAVSEPVQPIVYYLDRGAPEPVRSALLDGARWWAAAFEAAGFRNAFRVEMMPEGADPMDVRYNVIQWVHRATRGWSYGSTVVDPRTGEIIKGHVTLGSQRVRQDYLIATALLAPFAKGAPPPAAMQELALARLRQLAAHEVGHTLGLMHNYTASTVGRASVMDYPPPVATLRPDGTIDTATAYATGIGAWDKLSITWGYREYPAGSDERAAGSQFLLDAFAAGQRFLTDQDARPAGSSSSLAHLWDAGGHAVDELDRIMKLRAAALGRFGEANIRDGAPLATLEDALVPLYLLHRYQVEAATKLIGGVDYTFALRGDGQIATRPVAPAEQRRALAAVLATLAPQALALPDALVAMAARPRALQGPHVAGVRRAGSGGGGGAAHGAVPVQPRARGAAHRAARPQPGEPRPRRGDRCDPRGDLEGAPRGRPARRDPARGRPGRAVRSDRTVARAGRIAAEPRDRIAGGADAEDLGERRRGARRRPRRAGAPGVLPAADRGAPARAQARRGAPRRATRRTADRRRRR